MTEKRLIDANAAKGSFCGACSTKKRYGRTDEICRNHIESYGNGCFKMRLIDKIPTVDAVEVVRCKDCKHYTPVEGGKPLCALHTIAVTQDDFCSYGERR